MNINELLPYFQGVKQTKQGSYQARCPAHDDKTASLTISIIDNKILLHDHAGCQTADILAQIGLNMKDLFYNIGNGHRGPAKVIPFEPQARLPEPKKPAKVFTREQIERDQFTVALYDYTDATGKLAYIIQKKKGKEYSVYASIGDGKFVTGLNGGAKYLYNLPEVIEAVKAGMPIYIPEGEKDCETLRKLGLVATTNPFGAKSKWLSSYNEYLKGADIILLPDNDKPGRDHVKEIKDSLAGIARSIRVVNLPDLAEKQDITDWIEKGGTMAQLKALVDDEPVIEQQQQAKTSSGKSDNLLIWEYLSHGEAGDSSLVEKAFADKYLYCHDEEQWLINNQGIWEPEPTDKVCRKARTIIQAKYKPLLDSARSEIDQAGDKGDVKRITKKVEAIEKRIKDADSIRHIRNVLQWTSGLLSSKTTDFDNERTITNLQNGVFDFEKCEFRKHLPSDRFRRVAGTSYDPKCKAPNWEQALELWTGSDPELVRFLRQICGCFLTGLTDLQNLFFAYGPGGNGKTTFFNALKMLLGDYFLTIGINTLLTTKFGPDPTNDYKLAQFPGARLAVASEIPKYGMLNEPLIKDMTGGDCIAARHPKGRPFNFMPTHKLVMFGNHKPQVRDFSEGFWRRLLLIPFDAVISGSEKKDPSVIDAEFKKELPGILNWGIAGWRDYKQNGLVIPDRVRAAVIQYRNETDVISEFFTDNEPVLRIDKKDRGLKILASELFTLFKQWVEQDKDSRENPFKNIRGFNLTLKERGFRLEKGTQNKLFCHGVDLKSNFGNSQVTLEMPDIG